MRTIKFLIRIFRYWKKTSKIYNSYAPSCRIVNLGQNETGIYYAKIQMIGKNSYLKMEPEKILTDDTLLNCFSQTDVRTLAYFGYLGINGPKYEILEKRLLANNDQMLFAIRKKGGKNFKIVTANEISNNEEILRGLSQKDAHMIGITTAFEQSTILEKKQIELMRQMK
jgi:hypothetical protein